MNKLVIVGNLTRDPELRSTQSGVSVCSFTVAVNRRRRQGQEQTEADFFNVSAWRELGENCAKYLAKGRKVFVSGPVSCQTYDRRDGGHGASMNVVAEDVEFLSPKGETGTDYQDAPQEFPQEQPQVDAQSGFSKVDVESDELPF